jgi:hypothetical protein
MTKRTKNTNTITTKESHLDRMVREEVEKFENNCKKKWALGFNDRGLGHGDFGIIIDGTSEVVVAPLDSIYARHIISLHNASLT